MPNTCNPEVITVPGFATVTIDEAYNCNPVVQIKLDPRHDGTVDALTIDIDDFLPQHWSPGGVYFEGSNANSANDPKLIRFIELCEHWDGDLDGVFDADVMKSKILRALERCDVDTVPFRRPSRGLYTRLLMEIMPPVPERHIVMSYEDLKPRFRLHHYLLGVPTILAIFGLIQVQIYFLPWMQYSVVSGLSKIGSTYGRVWMVALVAVYVLASYLLSRKRASTGVQTMALHTYGFFNKAAAYEEQAFREGCENWTWSQRVRSCLAFGALHMVNLVYPLALILPLALGGAVFMAVYLRNYRQTKVRRLAVLEASVTHRVYNRLALISVAIFVAIQLISLL